MRRSDTGDLWWKNALFYCADVETFYAWNGDGCGDIRGMTERIEYLFDLGVTCLWLMPFYPPRPGEQPLATRPQDERVLPSPFLQAPARPQRRQPQSAGGDFTHTGLLA
jgi:Alpha amylase, catalytic domain